MPKYFHYRFKKCFTSIEKKNDLIHFAQVVGGENTNVSLRKRLNQASWGTVSERIMGEPSCNSCCSDSRSAGVMRWTSLQSDNREAESGAES